MADVKITDLPALAAPALTDVVPVVDLAGPATKKATLASVRAAMVPIALASDVSGTLPVANGGTGATTSTGTGAVVLGTSPTLSNPDVTVTSINNATSGGTINDCTLSGTSGSTRRVRFTDATGPAITGFDATGVADGTILRVLSVAGTLSISHEDAGSSAANRVTLSGGFAITVPPGVFTCFEYDAAGSRWRHIGATSL